MNINQVPAKSILSKSAIFDYVINPYIGCQHSCAYCYARFMKRFTGHKEAWGEFIDVKMNAPLLLEKEIKRKSPGRVWLSGFCDPYQPVEEKYGLTRACLEILVHYKWAVTVQTKSVLVLRDMALFKGNKKIEVGMSVTTSDEGVRQLFEPGAASIEARIGALEVLHSAGIRTFAMIAPLLPGGQGLAGELKGKVDYVFVDRMNYHYADCIYRENGLFAELSDKFFVSAGKRLAADFERQGTECTVLF